MRDEFQINMAAAEYHWPEGRDHWPGQGTKGAIVTAPVNRPDVQAQSDSVRSPFLVVMMFFTLILTASSMASIVDAAYVWGEFFQNIIQVYRQFGELVFLPLMEWIGMDVPVLARDIIIFWLAFGSLGNNGTILYYKMRPTLSRRFFFWISGPVVLVYFFGKFMTVRDAGYIREIGNILFFTAIPLLTILFIDWQFMNHAAG